MYNNIPPAKSLFSLHNSLSDWDILYISSWNVSPYATLSRLAWVSLPTSLRFFPRVPAFGSMYALSTHPHTQNLKHGRIVTSATKPFDESPPPLFYFGVTPDNHSGSYVKSSAQSVGWLRSRITWWPGENDDDILVTLYLVEDLIDDVWVFKEEGQCPLLTGAINRCGVGPPRSVYSHEYFIDDTEIWMHL